MSINCTNPDHTDLRDCEGNPAECTLHDHDDIAVHGNKPSLFSWAGVEPVERRTKVAWCVGGREVLIELGDGTCEVMNPYHMSTGDLERLFVVIGDLLAITELKPQPKGS